MKTANFCIAVSAFALLSISSIAGGAEPPAMVHLAVGKIVGVDTSDHLLTIAHQAIPSMGMPAMTMDFPVLPAVDVSSLAAGQTVAFVLAPNQGGIAISVLLPVAGDADATMTARCQETMSRE